MGSDKLTVAVIGCGRMGQQYATVYATRPDTELVAIAEANPERRRAVGERFGVSRLFAGAAELFASVVPDVAAVVLPVRYIKDAVLAAVAAGVRGVTTDKPIAATLADADAMVDACERRGIVFGGGNLQRARGDVQEAARWIRHGDFGQIKGAAVHRWGGGEISGGGCQHVSVLRLLADAEVAEVVAWGQPAHKLAEDEDDAGLAIHAQFTMSSGLPVPVFADETPHSGVDLWTDDALIRWEWDATTIYAGSDATGRVPLQRPFTPVEYPRFSYLGTSIGSFLDAVRTGSELWISGHDLRQALEVAIAAKRSAALGSMPVTLPLQDRGLTLRPRAYRWLGGDVTGLEQSLAEASTPWAGND